MAIYSFWLKNLVASVSNRLQLENEVPSLPSECQELIDGNLAFRPSLWMQMLRERNRIPNQDFMSYFLLIELNPS